MKSNYNVETKGVDNPAFIIVSNYPNNNEVKNWRFDDLEMICKLNDVGFWRIKYKKDDVSVLQ